MDRRHVDIGVAPFTIKTRSRESPANLRHCYSSVASAALMVRRRRKEQAGRRRSNFGQAGGGARSHLRRAAANAA
jgi:hypothetical protein